MIRHSVAAMLLPAFAVAGELCGELDTIPINQFPHVEHTVMCDEYLFCSEFIPGDSAPLFTGDTLELRYNIVFDGKLCARRSLVDDGRPFYFRRRFNREEACEHERVGIWVAQSEVRLLMSERRQNADRQYRLAFSGDTLIVAYRALPYGSNLKLVERYVFEGVIRGLSPGSYWVKVELKTDPERGLSRITIPSE